MIEIVPNFDAQLVADIQEYYEENILPHIRLYSSTILSDEKKDLFNRILSDDAVISLINASPDALETYATQVYSAFPEFAVRYHPYLIYRNIAEDLSTFENIENVTGNERIIHQKAQSTITFINQVEAEKNAELFGPIKQNLVEGASNTKKLSALKKVQSFKSQNYRITKPYIDALPSWTKSPFDMFNYKDFRSLFGRRVIEAHGLSICPFCAQNSVDIVDGLMKSHLPALDHYLPKSKYPFFALSLHNLLPTCGRCNSSFKGETDMCQSYYHPLRDRINGMDIFNFNIAFDAPFFNPPLESLSIQIECNDAKIMNNASLFELNGVYNLPECKKVFFDVREKYEFHKNRGEESIVDIISSDYLTKINFNIDRTADPKKHSLQKFEIEVLKKISEDDMP